MLGTTHLDVVWVNSETDAKRQRFPTVDVARRPPQSATGVGGDARVAMETVDDLQTRDVFEAATVGGAKALGRDDIGRLAPGCKADFVSADIKDPSMMPLREPLRSLIFVAADRAVRDVYVDGERVVADGRPLNIDLEAASEALEAAQKRSIEQVPGRDWAGRGADELAPMVLQTVERLN